MAQNDENNIYFNFSYLALKLLGKGLYSNTWAALSELIANSIDAEAKEIYILFNYSNENRSLEIFDSGNGMSYEDLSKRYVWVGRNKREDQDEKHSSLVMGRKGIGKLAALYLSNNYYILSKKENVEEVEYWHLNLNDALDSEIPRLQKSNLEEANVSFYDLWYSKGKGTYIKLNNVDMKHIGEKTLDSLKARFANFFLLNEIDCDIKIGILDNGCNISDVVFEPISKNIAFKNMCAIYSDDFKNINEFLSSGVSIPYSGNIKEIKEQKFPVVKINADQFQNLNGKMEFDIDGKRVVKEYQLSGWIGIHASINVEEANMNDANFLKNGTYNPNHLRLYVRKKLACDNFMEYLKNTQAFGAYIEGEISFDILDDDSLEDIATSNRQGYVEDDSRVKKLIEILKPIIGMLISTRVKFRSIILEEEEAFYEAEKKSREERIAEQKKALELAEQKAAELGIRLKKTQDEKQKQIEINQYITKMSKLKNRDIINIIHSIFNNCYNINMQFANLNPYYSQFSTPQLKILKKINKFNFLNYNIAKNVAQGGYAIPTTSKMLHLQSFISDYISNVLMKLYKDDLNIIVNNTEIDYIIKANPIYLTTILDNLIVNSIKAKSKNLKVSFIDTETQYKIVIEDDGEGFDSSINDLKVIYDFGFSTTKFGAGIGMFYVKEYILKCNGSIEAFRKDSGAEFILNWNK